MAKQRMTFLDVFRGLAVFWMVETHVTDVCLAASEKLDDRLWLLNLSNGFVAVTFIFCAGASFWLVASKKEADFRSFGPGLRKYLERIFFILLVGYLMHLPTPSFQDLLRSPYEVWQRFLAIDVLPLIAYSSLLALLVFWALPKVRWLPYAALVLALAVFGGTRAVWHWDAYDHGLPLGIAGLLGRQPEVMFPLLPWSGYFFAGLAMAGSTEWLLERPRFAALGALAALGAGLGGFSQQTPADPDWWWTAPNYFVFRMGITVAIYLGLMLLFRWFGEKRFWAARGLEIAGQESLFLYLVHVFLVYGTVWEDTSLRKLIGDGVPLAQNFGIFALVMALVYAAMLGYRWTKQRWPDYAKWAKYGVVGVLIVQFLLK
jgi:uncharacterized membrane protein